MYLKVKVRPDQKEDKLEKLKDNEFRIFVRAKPERGMANKRVLELLASYLGVPINKLIIINGHNSPSKLISVHE